MDEKQFFEKAKKDFNELINEINDEGTSFIFKNHKNIIWQWIESEFIKYRAILFYQLFREKDNGN